MKGMKKVAAGLLAAALVVGTSGVTGVMGSTHKSPVTNLPCDSTYRTYSHTGYSTSVYAGSHIVEKTGMTCNKTSLVYVHRVTCASCTAVIKDGYTYGCTMAHSVCGSNECDH